MNPINITDRLANLSPAKRALFEQRLKEKGLDTLAGRTIPRRASREFAPLSFAQQRLWFLSQLEPESCTYNETSALRLDGELNIKALHGALNAIVERHEVLRTTYAMADDGYPVQIVGAVQAVDLPVLDISELAGSQQNAEVQRLALEFKARPFDLSKDMPLRLALIKRSPRAHVLITVKHHIASDGWSSGVWSRELAALYEAFTQGRPNPLAEMQIQYSDYAVWQREWLQGEVLEKQLAYWKGQLEDVPILNLPTDRPRGASAKHSGAKKTLTLPKTLIDRLKALSSQEGVTLFMTLLAAFQVLLHRYTGQDDIAVGSPIAGRTRAETEGLIGFFVNTLVLRTKLADNPKFNELLARVRNIALQAYEHQDLPFEKLVEELNPERNQSQTPLFQVSFAVQNVPRSNLDIPGLKVTPVEIDSSGAKFDIFAAFIEREREMMVRIEYRTELFEAATIARMFGHFQVLLEGIVVDPDRRISELPILTESERHQLLVEWNDTKRDYPSDKCVHQLFEEQVERSPEATAVVFEDQQLTYRELNKRANQLAHYLRKLGVDADVLVGLCVERSLEMIVALLGILKAGGAYVPLDSSYPKERLAFMLEDAEARVLITQAKFLPSIDHRTVVCLDRDWQEIAKENVKSPQNQTTTETLAYVIYTSGSTGAPKGVMIPHRGLVNYLSWATAAYGVAAGQGAPLHSSIGFDLSITSLFTPLLVGRRVVILAEDRSVEALSSLLSRETDFSLIKITPAHLEVLSQELPADKLARCARALIIGGEALTFEKLAVWSKHAPGTRLINEYGPTETVVGCCVYEVAPGNLPSGPVPIGRPIANTQLYILDRYLQPVPIGVAGELHIGGDGLARGYLNRSELNAEKFIANPFSADPTSRLYKTGDLARYLADKNIEFLGRIDDQVKIRGYRIELGEIEATLVQHPSIRESVVLAREDSPGDRRLVAYVVAPSDTSTNELRSFLKQKLPEFMVPSAFVCLDSLPLTPNGKVDRRALPAPAQSRPELDETFSDPRTPTEDLLANIWAEVLKLEKIGIHDNFFDLGGHSLVATRVASRIREVFRIELPLRALFEMPTVAGLSDHIESIRWAGDENQPTSKEGLDQTEEIIL